MKNAIAFATAFVFVLVVSAMATTASAYPSFAKKLGTDEAAGHHAWPMLNKFGRDLKESGYDFGSGVPSAPKEDAKKDDSGYFGTGIQPNFLVKGYFYDKKGSGKDAKLRPLHEYEVIIGQRISENSPVSMFFEVEGEDETGFEPEMEAGVVGYHFSKQLNFHGGYGSVFFADPYDTLSDIRRMTRNSKSKALGNDIVSPRQFLSVSGRLDKLFYIVGYGGNLGDTEGVDPNAYTGRVAYDVMKQFTVGAFGIKSDLQKTLGFDMQTEINNFVGRAAYILNDPEKGESTTGYYMEGSYMYQGPRLIVPTIRFEQFEVAKKGTQTELTSNISVYITHSLKIGLEYWKTLDVAPKNKDDNRVTAMFTFVF